MEGSESGALVPSDTTMEVETWVKLSNFPAEFLTAEAISLIVSSFGSPVAADEDTYEKVENHKRPPKLRRKLHSRKTFVTILVRVSVTKPLPSRVTVGCPKGREYIIRLDFDPTPKVCLLCLGAGHFDLECCGTEEATVEIMEDDAEAGEDFLGVDLQLADCFDSMSDEVDGEQGAVTTDGVESFEDSTVVEAVNLPAATCDIGDALVGELEAVHTILDGFFEHSLVERTAAVLEVQPLLPATIAADGSEGTVISDGFISDNFDDEPSVGQEIVADLLATVGESITVERIAAVSCLVDEQVVGFNVLLPFEPRPFFMLQFIMDKVFNDFLMAAGNLFGLLFFSLKFSSIELSSFEDFSVVKSSRQHHKWREKTVEQGFMEGKSGSGERLLGVDMQDADCICCIIAHIDGIQVAIIIDRAVCYENPPDFEAALEEDFHNFGQVFFVVNSSKKHHKWRDKSDVQGLFCCSNVQGFSGFDEQPSVEIKETAVLPFSAFGPAIFGASPAAILQGRTDPCIDEDSFEELDVLQCLGRLRAATNSTHDQLIFKVQHKWRDKSMGWSADLIWDFLMLYKKKKKKKKMVLLQQADGFWFVAWLLQLRRGAVQIWSEMSVV